MACIDGGPSTCTVISDTEDKFNREWSWSSASTKVPSSVSCSPHSVRSSPCSRPVARRYYDLSTLGDGPALLSAAEDGRCDSLPSSAVQQALSPASPTQERAGFTSLAPLPPPSIRSPLVRPGSSADARGGAESSRGARSAPRPSRCCNEVDGRCTPPWPPHPPQRPWNVGLDDGSYSRSKTPRLVEAFLRAAPAANAEPEAPGAEARQSALTKELEVAHLLRAQRLRDDARWRPERWLEAREEATKDGRHSDLALLARNVRQFTDLAIERGAYWIDREPSTWPSGVTSDGGAKKGVMQNLRSEMSRAPRVEWFGHSNVDNYEVDQALPTATPVGSAPLIFDGTASSLDVALSMRRRGLVDKRVPVVIVAEVNDFDMSGSVDIVNSNSMTPRDLLLRTDFATFLEEARRALAADGGQASVKNHLTSAQNPYIFRCPGVTVFRGPQSDGYPFLEEPMHVHVLVTAMSNPFPRVTIKDMKRYGKLEWYTDHADHVAILERLHLLGAVARQGVEGAEGHEIEKPVLLMPAPGCDANIRQPREAVGILLKHWQQRFSRLFATVVVCCSSRGMPDTDLAAWLDTIANRPSGERRDPHLRRGQGKKLADLMIQANVGILHDLMEVARTRVQGGYNEEAHVKSLLYFAGAAGAEVGSALADAAGEASELGVADITLGAAQETRAANFSWNTDFELANDSRPVYAHDLRNADIGIAHGAAIQPQTTSIGEVASGEDCGTLKLRGKAFLQVSLKLKREQALMKPRSRTTSGAQTEMSDVGDTGDESPWISGDVLQPRGSCSPGQLGPAAHAPSRSKRRHRHRADTLSSHDTSILSSPSPIEHVVAAESVDAIATSGGVGGGEAQHRDVVGAAVLATDPSHLQTLPSASTVESRHEAVSSAQQSRSIEPSENRRHSIDALMHLADDHRRRSEADRVWGMGCWRSDAFMSCEVDEDDPRIPQSARHSCAHGFRSDQLRAEHRERLRRPSLLRSGAASAREGGGGVAPGRLPAAAFSSDSTWSSQESASASGGASFRRASKLRQPVTNSTQATAAQLAHEKAVRNERQFQEAGGRMRELRDAQGELRDLAQGLAARMDQQRKSMGGAGAAASRPASRHLRS